jgi:hypothetical protein
VGPKGDLDSSEDRKILTLLGVWPRFPSHVWKNNKVNILEILALDTGRDPQAVFL